MATTAKKTDEPVKKTAGTARGKTRTAAAQEGTAKAPAAKKPATKTRAAQKATQPEPASGKMQEPKSAPPEAGQTQTMPVLTPEQRRLYVEVAAYYIAERRGFVGGSELEDWLQAEAEIDRLLREGILKP
ncbi:MAG: DUF2934 domain-containing protein [Rhodocyclaceae bacterium]